MKWLSDFPRDCWGKGMRISNRNGVSYYISSLGDAMRDPPYQILYVENCTSAIRMIFPQFFIIPRTLDLYQLEAL